MANVIAIERGVGGGGAGEGSAVDRAGGSQAAADRAVGQARVGAGPAGVDHYGVGVGTTVPAIARLVQAHEDTVRDVIHSFNERGLAALDPRWAGGRPRQITSDDERYIVQAATTRPAKLGRPFTHWSIRKLADYLADNPIRGVKVGRERLRQILHRRGISFQRTRTWKESRDPDKDAKLDRIEEVTSRFPDRCFAFDQFGPLSIRPCHGTC
jgi:transposase